MELRRLLVIARRRLGLLIALVVVGLLGAYLGTSRTSSYSATTTVYIGEPTEALNPTSQYGQIILATALATDIPTPAVVGKAIAATGEGRSVSAVVKKTTAIVSPGTNLIHIAVSDRDAVVAQTLANAVAHAFIGETTALLPYIGASGGPKNQPVATLAQAAVLPSSPLPTSFHRNVALGGLAGLLVGIALVLLLDYVGLSARSPRQLETALEMPLLGVIPLQPEVERAPAAEAGTPVGDIALLRSDFV